MNASGGTANYTSVYIYPTISGLSISGNFAAAPTIDLNGADNVTIDGSVNASGSTKDLNIINLNTSGLDFTSTIRFINDASGNTVKFCNLKGSSTGSTQARTLLFSTAGSGTGNDNNTVEHNDITCTEDANRPQNSIHSYGTEGKENSGNIISNNNLFNFMQKNEYSYGIHLNNYNTDWTISGNSFYETSVFEPTSDFGSYTMIRILNEGSNDTVSGNHFGGTTAGCGGTPLTKNSSPQYTNGFAGI